MKEITTVAVLATIDQQAFDNFWKEFIADFQTEKFNNFQIGIADLTGRNILYNIFKLTESSFVHPLTTVAPAVQIQNCKFCADCMKKCDFDVIAFHKKEKKATVQPESCIDCGKCYKTCKQKNAIKRTEYNIGLVEGNKIAANISVFKLSSDSKKTMRKLGLAVVADQLADGALLLMAIDSGYAGKKMVEQANLVFNPDKDGDFRKLGELLIGL